MFRRFLSLILFVNGFWLFAAEDITDVRNSKVPKENLTIALEEDLRIGPDHGDDQYIWTRNTAVNVNEKGHMFVTDTGGFRIVELAPDGSFVREIGGQGQGPGEFENLSSFQVFNDGTGMAFEAKQAVWTLTFFDAGMQYVDRQSVEGFTNIVTQLQFSPGNKWGWWLSSAVNMQTGQIMNSFQVINAKREVQMDLVAFESPAPDPTRVMESSFWAEFLGKQMKQPAKGLVAFVAFDEKDQVYTARANQYQITQWSSDLKPVRTFGRDYDPITFTEAQVQAVVEPVREQIHNSLPASIRGLITPNVVKQALEIAEFPPVKHPVAGIKVLPDGTVLVIHDADFEKDAMVMDMFREGVYVGQATMAVRSGLGMVFKGDYAYTVERDDEDENQLVRYRYKVVKKK